MYYSLWVNIKVVDSFSDLISWLDTGRSWPVLEKIRNSIIFWKPNNSHLLLTSELEVIWRSRSQQRLDLKNKGKHKKRNLSIKIYFSDNHLDCFYLNLERVSSWRYSCSSLTLILSQPWYSILHVCTTHTYIYIYEHWIKNRASELHCSRLKKKKINSE